MEAAATPFPREETTPPVTKIYFGAVRKVPRLPPGESAYKTLSWEMLRVSNCDFYFLLLNLRQRREDAKNRISKPRFVRIWCQHSGVFPRARRRRARPR